MKPLTVVIAILLAFVVGYRLHEWRTSGGDLYGPVYDYEPLKR